MLPWCPIIIQYFNVVCLIKTRAFVSTITMRHWNQETDNAAIWTYFWELAQISPDAPVICFVANRSIAELWAAFCFHVLSVSFRLEKSLSFSLTFKTCPFRRLQGSYFGLVWCFLVIKFRLCFVGRRSTTVTLQCPRILSAGGRFPFPPLLEAIDCCDHLVRMVPARLLPYKAALSHKQVFCRRLLESM